MEKIEEISQARKNIALVEALKTRNSILIELVLELKPNVGNGGEELLQYAITSRNFELLGEMLREPEISENKKMLKEGLHPAESLTTDEWNDVLQTLKDAKASAEVKDVVMEVLLESKNPSIDVIIELINLGVKAYFWPMHLERQPGLAEKLFEAGVAKSVEFSRVALEMFCSTICKANRRGVVKKLIKDRPDFVGNLTEIAVTGGYSKIVNLLIRNKAITTIDDKLFEKAIHENHYLTVKCLVESGIHKLELSDLMNAAAFSTVRLLLFLVEQFKNQEGEAITDKFSSLIRVACIHNRPDSVVALLEAGYKCNFNENIKISASDGYLKMVFILLEYVTEMNSVDFDEAIKLAEAENHTETAKRMRAYMRNNPHKFK